MKKVFVVGLVIGICISIASAVAIETVKRFRKNVRVNLGAGDTLSVIVNRDQPNETELFATTIPQQYAVAKTRISIYSLLTE